MTTGFSQTVCFLLSFSPCSVSRTRTLSYGLRSTLQVQIEHEFTVSANVSLGVYFPVPYDHDSSVALNSFITCSYCTVYIRTSVGSHCIGILMYCFTHYATLFVDDSLGLDLGLTVSKL